MALFDDIRDIMEFRAPEKLPVFALSQEFDALNYHLTLPRQHLLLGGFFNHNEFFN